MKSLNQSSLFTKVFWFSWSFPTEKIFFFLFLYCLVCYSYLSMGTNSDRTDNTPMSIMLSYYNECLSSFNALSVVDVLKWVMSPSRRFSRSAMILEKFSGRKCLSSCLFVWSTFWQAIDVYHSQWLTQLMVLVCWSMVGCQWGSATIVLLFWMACAVCRPGSHPGRQPFWQLLLKWLYTLH